LQEENRFFVVGAERLKEATETAYKKGFVPKGL
jgi:hypothetical protein